MKRGRSLLPIILPLMFLLLGTAVYQYGHLDIRSQLAEQTDTVAMKSKILQRYLSLIAEKPALERELVSLRETRRLAASKLFEGQTAPLAAAALQNTVKDAIASRGGSISSERVERPEDSGEFKMVTVTIDAIMPDVRTLGDTLLAIETQSPYLVVRELDARVRNFREPRELTVRMKISGLTEGR